MASADHVKALIKSHISRDDRHFYSVAMQVAAHEARQGHGRLAEEFVTLPDKGKATPTNDKRVSLFRWPVQQSREPIWANCSISANLITFSQMLC